MTATDVNGVRVVADDPTPSPLTDRGGNRVIWERIRTLRLEDGSTVYGCVHCTFVRESAGGVVRHLSKHTRGTIDRLPSRGAVDPLVAALAVQRDRQGRSLNFMERRTGYARATLRRWEKGVSDPGITSLRDYAEALGFDIVLVRRPVAELAEKEAS